MDITFRTYTKDDLIRCAELSVDAWPIVSLIAEKENVITFMQAYVELSLTYFRKIYILSEFFISV